MYILKTRLGKKMIKNIHPPYFEISFNKIYYFRHLSDIYMFCPIFL